MTEFAFAQSYPASRRVAAVLAAKAAALHGLSNTDREDLSQEALLELWRKAAAFDERRAGWRTYSERVVASRLSSLLRRAYSSRSGHGREDSLEGLKLTDPAPADLDLRADVRRVLDGLRPLDRSVALCLIDYSAIETGHRLGVARATVYRSIKRLRVAFMAAGLHRMPGRTA